MSRAAAGLAAGLAALLIALPGAARADTPSPSAGGAPASVNSIATQILGGGGSSTSWHPAKHKPRQAAKHKKKKPRRH